MLQDTRTHVVGELYDTERSYVESLQILVEKYMKPLKSLESNRVLIDSNLVDEIFYTIPEILQHHETFLSALQDRLSSDWDTSQVIGDVFIEAFTNEQIIDTYTAFINNWKNARHAIEVATQAKPAFERFLETISREHRNKLTLDALLIMPVQRIPRYELLIKELIKHTPENHPDYGPLIEAQKGIHELALKIDRAEKEMIHQEQLKDLESLIDGHVELQHPQRDFIRYDLVTILGSTALTVAKKERVLFLFCDLLIMTSVKKKASRRSHLQNAFANSYNDLSLLEGNKFKLLLRVSLDQVEIHLASDQIQLQQEQQHQLQAQQQQQRIRLIEDQRCEIEADLYLLHQIDSLISRLTLVDRCKMNESLNESIGHLKQRLFDLEHNDKIQSLSGPYLSSQQHSLQLASDQYATQSLTSVSSSPNMQCQNENSSLPGALNYTNPSSANNQNAPSQTHTFATTSNTSSPANPLANNPSSNQQQDSSDTSLEFIISSSVPSKDVSTSNSASLASANEQANEQGQGSRSTVDAQFGQHQSSSSETLVVTFASIDRKQAFLQAFIEAKQQRYQLLQHRQQSQQKIFSSSITLKLTQPGSLDQHSQSNEQRRNKLQHQDNVELARLTGASSSSPLHGSKMMPSKIAPAATSRISSAPLSQSSTYGQTIVHQMSAPQSLALAAVLGSPISAGDRGSSQCIACLSNPAIRLEKRPHDHHHHHHHQLMHQPASQPASLDTICCRELHNDQNDSTKAEHSTIKRLGQLDELADLDPNSRLAQHQLHLDYCKQADRHRLAANSILVLTNADSDNPGLISNASSKQPAIHLERSLLFRSAPKYFTTLPMNFLNTQHPALQFTCSAFRRQAANSNGDHNYIMRSTNSDKFQTVSDSSGQLWLCMSNGYVSHISLISMKRECNLGPHMEGININDASGLQQSAPQQARARIVPIIHSAGDICKSHLTCIAQVSWSKRGPSRRAPSREAQPAKVEQHANEGRAAASKQEGHQTVLGPVEVAIKSASPPVDIRSRSETPKDALGGRLSESAPSHSDAINTIKTTAASVSTTKLEVPSRSHKSGGQAKSNALLGQRTGSHIDERGRLIHSSICQRHYHHNNRHIPNRLSVSSSANQQEQANLQQPPGHNQHHHHHQRNCVSSCDHHRSGHGNYHGHSHSHSHSHHAAQSHHSYIARHNTVPLGELRKALERQNKVGEPRRQARYHHLAPPTNTPADPAQVSPNNEPASPKDPLSRSLEISHEEPITKNRSSTPPAGLYGAKSFRSPRLLRHQASLKTSSILAKLVAGAGKRSSYMKRKSSPVSDKQQPDIDDKDTDVDSANHNQIINPKQHQEDSKSIDSNILALTTPGAKKYPMNSFHSDTGVVSPLSSASSLTSTNSSINVNSMCASSPNWSNCDLLAHSYSTSCCAGASLEAPIAPNAACSIQAGPAECGLRSRSATVPCRSSCLPSAGGPDEGHEGASPSNCQSGLDRSAKEGVNAENDSYRVSEIVGSGLDNDTDSSQDGYEVGDGPASSLWLGCDDGSLIIIDCLTNYLDSNDCNFCDLNQRNLSCSNVHSEIKLNAPICDIIAYKDRMVFVSLSNGQLAVFSNKNNAGQDNTDDTWSLKNPKLLTVTVNELNSVSKMCIIGDEHLWFSYGRNIFVLNIGTLKLETTIMVPTNDLSLQFTMQSIVIDSMELMGKHPFIWISFRNSHLIQLYDVKTYTIMLELNLFEPIDKMLSFGNEIIRHHKTACLKATSLLNVDNVRDKCNTLFIGTSAGIILYLNLTYDKLARKDPPEGCMIDWKPQVAGLRHGHTGQVKLLHLLGIEENRDQENERLLDENNNSTPMIGDKTVFLISGGTGVDLYGPNEDQQAIRQRLNNEDDSLNHLTLWEL